MGVELLSDECCARASERIGDVLGLHFPSSRWSDLRRGLGEAAHAAGSGDVAAWVDTMVSGPMSAAQIAALAEHLTVGETYFFRDKRTFDRLATEVLPGLLRARHGCGRGLRIWSAACCTGEEAYSLAILLHELLPDRSASRATIVATDVNPRFLRQAMAGTFSEWSFRDVAPAIKQRYFARSADGRYVLSPAIRGMVAFAPLNMVTDPYPGSSDDRWDLILCRNMLIYFRPVQVRRIVDKLYQALADDGWLALGASELALATSAGFQSCDADGLPLLRKRAAQAHTRHALYETLAVPTPSGGESPAPCEGDAADRRRAADAPSIAGSAHHPRGQTYESMTRELADQGRLRDALAWCERWLASDGLDSTAHHFRAVILIELGELAEARRALQRAVYLCPDFALAHFALGTLARRAGRRSEAGRHFRNALAALAPCRPGEPLAGADGIAAGTLGATVRAALGELAAP